MNRITMLTPEQGQLVRERVRRDFRYYGRMHARLCSMQWENRETHDMLMGNHQVLNGLHMILNASIEFGCGRASEPWAADWRGEGI